jgi:phosphatidylglycerol:prolipoprotein diacylglycerol transferase
VHPTQLYEVALGVLMFWVLWRLRRHRHAPGWLMGVWAILAGIERFIIEYFRAKDDHLGIGLTQAQLIGVAAMIVGAVILYLRRSRESAAVA